MSAFWTRAGTWGIASSQEPAGGGAASCLMAKAYPAVVPALLRGNYFCCGSNGKSISDLVILSSIFENEVYELPYTRFNEGDCCVGVAMSHRRAHLLSMAHRESHPPAT
ncbi:hypothetical protein [Sporosarcina sp. P3]|uniref:hypothetical protein n=1 Tax=Sporosarcina sp. P3 TaxID=2048245 RepID=UPI00117AC609|nr:hypothetical protein [Sporosarcina sp. P3]